MRIILFSILLGCLLIACTKEVQIDIPGYEEQLVVDGRIETNGFPILLLSTSQNVYTTTSLATYLNSIVTDATVSVNNGNITLQLQLFLLADLPLESQKRVAEMLSLELNQIAFLPIQVYSTTDESLLGEVGKTYQLKINQKGKEYTAETTLLPPVALDNVYWKPEIDNPQFGVCWAKLSDPANQYNAYKWEVKLITSLPNGSPKDKLFRSRGNPFFQDKFFDGLTFEFDTKYPEKDTTYPSGFKHNYRLGDSLVIKLSRLDGPVFNFFDKKIAQMQTSSNPFSTPVNIPTNVSGGALGIWAGYSPWYDTLYCVQ